MTNTYVWWRKCDLSFVACNTVILQLKKHLGNVKKYVFDGLIER